MKIERIISALLIALALLVNSFGPANAKPQPDPMPACQFNPVSITTEIGIEQLFHITNPDPSSTYTWIWGDSTDSKLGSSSSHAWNALGRVKMHVLENGLDGFSRCYSWVTVIAGNRMEIPDLENDDDTKEKGDLPKPPSVVEVPVITTGDIASYENGMAENAGENAFSVVNTGEGDIEVRIEQAPAPVVVPTPVAPIVPDDNSCYGNCASNGGTIIINPAPVQNSSTQVRTMPRSLIGLIFYVLSHGVSTPLRDIETWILENM